MMNSQSFKSAAPPSTNNILRFLYFTHFLVIAIYTSYILFIRPQLVTPTVTFVMLILYGYLFIWSIVIGWLMAVCGKAHWAVCFNRIFIKFVIIMFPLFGILSLSLDNYLQSNEVKIFVLYMGIVALALLIYEIVCCTCLAEKVPAYLYEPNDLSAQTRIIRQKMSAYNANLS